MFFAPSNLVYNHNVNVLLVLKFEKVLASAEASLSS
jgi:hypothetical protein